MKKIVMATLLMALTSVASAQVSLSGKISKWADNSEVGGVSTTSMKTEPTSNFALNFSEKLAGGMVARGTLETSLSGNTVSGSDTRLGDRQGTVGVASSFASLDVGRNVHSHFLAITANDVFGTMYGSVAGDVHNFRALRLDDAFFLGLQPMKNVMVAVERSQTVGATADVFGLSAKLGMFDVRFGSFSSGKEKSTAFGLTTKLAGTTVTFTHSDDEGVVNSKGDLLGVARAFGPITAKASFGKTNKDVKAYALGLDYAFSKRTEMGVRYRNVNRAGSASDVAAFGVGVTHRF